MASDYGDDAGEKMIDDFMRFGERMGERAMYRRAERLKLAFENATDKARGAAAADGGRTEPATGEEHLLFRIVDAKEVWRSFDELSRETDAACGRAAAELAKRDARAAARPRDGRPLAVRAEQARSASEAIEAARATTRGRARAPRPQKARAR